jgi:HTH-type transcriptional regulator / antitoxin HipB
MKISHWTTGLVMITPTYLAAIPNASTQKNKEVVNKSKHTIEDNVILRIEINGKEKPIMRIHSGISEWGDSYVRETRCKTIKFKDVDVSVSLVAGAKNGYPVVCASENTRNTINAITLNQQLNTGFNMIQNEHQYKVSQGKVKEIEQYLDQLYKEKDSLHPRQFKMRENGLQGILEEIQEEIKKYDALKEKPTVIEIESFAEIPVALIKARIASGMTQKDLAEKLGMKEQQIQRYEANQYSSAGFHRLAEVADALEVTLNNSLLTLHS